MMPLICNYLYRYHLVLDYLPVCVRPYLVACVRVCVCVCVCVCVTKALLRLYGCIDSSHELAIVKPV